MRKAIGAFVFLSVAVIFRSGDITFGPAPPASLTPPVSSTPMAGRFDSAPGDSVGAGKPAPRRIAEKRREIPSDFINNPLLFLSTAPADSLALLPGIGPVLAERIAGVRTGKRSFTRWDDLLAVKGIGPKTLDRLKRLE